MTVTRRNACVLHHCSFLRLIGTGGVWKIFLQSTEWVLCRWLCFTLSCRRANVRSVWFGWLISIFCCIIKSCANFRSGCHFCLTWFILLDLKGIFLIYFVFTEYAARTKFARFEKNQNTSNGATYAMCQEMSDQSRGVSDPIMCPESPSRFIN